MKLILAFFCIFFTSYLNAQSIVEVKNFPEKIKLGEAFSFEVITTEDVEVEMAIFQNNFLGYQTKTALQKGASTFEVETEGWKSGKYFFLVKNKDVHIQRELFVE